jgi:TRAP-type C4-dicarboxylate transport system permease small subunit
MGLACTWRAGVHVRMELLIQRFDGAMRRVLEVGALAITFAACLYFTWFVARFVLESRQMNDMSQGLFPIPLWIPQSGMVLGLVLLCLAVAESLFDTAVRGVKTGSESDVLQRAANEL